MDPSRSCTSRPAYGRGCALAAIVFVFAQACDTLPAALPVALDPVTDAMNARNWLVQKVCADERGAVSVDPFSAGNPYGDGGCPKGTVQRDLLPSDRLPYYRYSDLTKEGGPWASTISTSVWDAHGDEFVLMQRSFRSDGKIEFSPKFSHYDTYRIGQDWISEYGTRDSNSFNATFFGATAGAVTPYNGWTDFPAKNFLKTTWTQETDFVLGNHWELCGVPPPGVAPAAPGNLGRSLLQYRLIESFPFGSIGGTKKVMNTMAANHQSAPVLFPANGNADDGHIEIWYFTIPYGPSRWEVWSAAECLKPHGDAPKVACGEMREGPTAYAASNYCSCEPTFTGNCSDGASTQEIPYDGEPYAYKRIMCRDWTNVVPASSEARATVPYWPTPQANLLQNFHFSEGDVAHPESGFRAHWKTDDSLVVTTEQSTALYDTTVHGGGPLSECPTGLRAGVRYVTARCTAATDGQCGSLAQDVPVAIHPSVMTSGTFAFGVTARTDAGVSLGSEIPTAPSGVLELTLEQVDAQGVVIADASSAVTSQTIGPAVAEAVTSSSPNTQENQIRSLMLSSAYVQSKALIQFDTRTTALRLRITPRSPGVTFDIVDASLARVGPPSGR